MNKYLILAAICFAHLSARPSVAADYTASDLVSLIEARRGEIVSGMIYLQRQTGFADRLGDVRSVEYVYVSEAGSWARITPGNKNKRVNRGGQLFRYHEVAQPDGSVHKSLAIEDQEDLARSELSCYGFFCGSIWHEETMEFLRSSVESIEISKSDEGLIVLEVPVAKKDTYQAFVKVSHPLSEGGKMAIFVDPELGYAIRLIRMTNAEGVVGCTFETTDFQNIGDGVFYPKECIRQTFKADKKPAYFEKYTLVEASLINQDIPDSMFEIDIPAGAVISDKRSDGIGATYVANSEPKSLDSVITELLAESGPAEQATP